MRVITGTVVDHRVELPAEAVADGTHVMVLAPETGEAVELSAEEQRELSEAMDEIERGEFIDGQDLLAELRARRSA